MRRLFQLLRFLFPLALAAVAGGIKIRAGQLGTSLALVMIGGALLGWAVGLFLESAAALLGLAVEGPSESRLEELEREKETLLRGIKEIELDAALQKLSAEEAAWLTEPLQQKALGVLRELDQARLEPRTVEERIEQELTRQRGSSG
jgi:hypothetical protein